MSDINLYGIYRQMQREFAVMGTGSERFDDDFIDAVNASIGQINVDADLSSELSEVSTKEDDVTGLDNKHRRMLIEGIRSNLASAGRRPSKGMEAYLTGADKRFEDRIWAYYADLKNEISYEDEDEICLGALD